MQRVETVKVRIGLEVHSQITTLKTKLFCGCSSDYRGKPPNTNVCHICMGLPGTMPMVNEKAVEFGIMVALALNCKTAEKMMFYRKNYFYPDMPKNFQISQYDKAGGVPLASDGYLVLDSGRKIGIRRIHLEEDPAKITYEGTIESSTSSLIDYNRAGMALMEIVTEPDLRSPKEAREFLGKLRALLEHLGISDGSLEGAMRCDANISLEDGKRVEVKNVSSFKEVERALNFEITRQKSRASRGLITETETRHWDEVRRVTFSLREKEEEQDYRYFPEPDLLPVMISGELLGGIKRKMPELPEARKERFIRDYGIFPQTASVLTTEKALADFFEETVGHGADPKEASNWIVSDVLPFREKEGAKEKTRPERVGDVVDVWPGAVLQSLPNGETGIFHHFRPEHLAQLLQLVDRGAINRQGARGILAEVVASGKEPEKIVEENDLKAGVDDRSVELIVEKVFGENPKAVEDALNNEKAVNYLIGLIMKSTGGKIDPSLANRTVRDRLVKLREQP